MQRWKLDGIGLIKDADTNAVLFRTEPYHAKQIVEEHNCMAAFETMVEALVNWRVEMKEYVRGNLTHTEKQLLAALKLAEREPR